jgi:hypothetical protein
MLPAAWALRRHGPVARMTVVPFGSPVTDSIPQRRSCRASIRIPVIPVALALLATWLCIPAMANSAMPTKPQGTIYFVAPGGDDSNSGDMDHPWQTIQHAADTLVAGDTVYIRAGTYYERVVPQSSGNSGNLIKYAAYPGEAVTIDGTGVTVPEYGGLFELIGKNYVQVSGLRVIHSSYYGIVTENSSYVTIDHSYTYDTYSSGISSWGSNHIIVDSNEVVGACTGPWQEHISISNTDTFEVRYNHVHDVMPGTQGKEGISVKDASSHGKVYGNQVDNINHVCIYVDAEAGHLFDVEVYQNIVHDIPADGFALAAEAGGLLESIRLYNNIAYHNLVGLWLSDCCTATHPFTDVIIINNTFAYNGRDSWGGGIGIQNLQVQNTGMPLDSGKNRHPTTCGRCRTRCSSPASTRRGMTTSHPCGSSAAVNSATASAADIQR